VSHVQCNALACIVSLSDSPQAEIKKWMDKFGDKNASDCLSDEEASALALTLDLTYNAFDNILQGGGAG
jgi:hypothetical protein